MIPRLLAGGSERVLTTLASNLDHRRFEIHVVALSGCCRHEFVNLPETVVVHTLGHRHVRSAAFGLLRLIWTLRPEVVLSAGGPSAVVASAIARLAPRGTRNIVRQGTMPSASAPSLNRWHRWAFAWSQRRADQVICQSQAMASDVVQACGVQRERIRVLYNPVTSSVSQSRKPLMPGGPKFLTVGRLAPEKRAELVLRAFAIIKAQYRDASLTIVGEGPCRSSLEALVASHKISHCVHFAGYRADVLAWMRAADVLLMTSAFEGLPNVVLEALSVGLPVVATACPGGIHEIAETTNNLMLVEEATPAALAEASSEILVKAWRRDPPGSAFWERFGIDAVVKRYEELLS